jgi:hypothetical protein
MTATYLVAFFGAAFAVTALFSWIHWVRHIDPPNAAEKQAAAHTRQAA